MINIPFEVTVLKNDPLLTQSAFDALLQRISLRKQERIKQYRYFADAQNSLLGDILARTMICRAAGYNNGQLKFSENGYGKPLLLNNPGIMFNISHSGRYIACAVCDMPVGIDIELIKPVDLKIAERFFAEAEIDYVMSRQGDAQIRALYEIWTKKESFIKQEGKGMSVPLPSFNVINPADSVSGGCMFYEINSGAETVCHVCAAKQEPPVSEIINTAELSGRIGNL